MRRKRRIAKAGKAGKAGAAKKRRTGRAGITGRRRYSGTSGKAKKSKRALKTMKAKKVRKTGGSGSSKKTKAVQAPKASRHGRPGAADQAGAAKKGGAASKLIAAKQGGAANHAGTVKKFGAATNVGAGGKNGKPAPQPAGKRRISDKWSKTLVLLRDGKLRSCVPLTRMLTKDSLSSMLQLYGMVYVKPTRGSLGRGVMKAELLSGGGKGASKRSYAYQLGKNRRKFETYDAFYRSLLKDTQGESYLVQKGIRLLTHKGLPFDIRLMVQRAPRGGWEATGTVGRVAHPSKIVTNGSQGGSIYPTAYLLKPYTSPKARRELLERMERIGIDTVRSMYNAYPGIVEIGLDLALDRNLKPWILEVNTVPDPCPFALLPDQTMLRRIVRYGKAYGRTYRLNCTKAKRGLQR